MEKRKHKRFTKRLETRFSSGGMSFSGVSSNLSERGMFIRTKRSFAPGIAIDIELVMPDGKKSFLKGIVIWTIKTPVSTSKNGMGVELIEKDAKYMDFLKAIKGEETTPKAASVSEFQIISCPQCNAKNKVLSSKISLRPRCGKCGASLIA